MERSVAGARRDAVVTEEAEARDPMDRGPSRVGHAPGLEHIRTVVVEDHEDIARLVAMRIATLIRERNAAGERTVLGLATGSTPIGVYRELIRMHRDEGLSFANVETFNLDEYYPMPKDSIHSYHRFMWENLFSQIDIKPENVHIPPGDVSAHRGRRSWRSATSWRSSAPAASTFRFSASARRATSASTSRDRAPTAARVSSRSTP